jgi:hypothetical protein
MFAATTRAMGPQAGIASSMPSLLRMPRGGARLCASWMCGWEGRVIVTVLQVHMKAGKV